MVRIGHKQKIEKFLRKFTNIKMTRPFASTRPARRVDKEIMNVQEENEKKCKEVLRD